MKKTKKVTESSDLWDLTPTRDTLCSYFFSKGMLEVHFLSKINRSEGEKKENLQYLDQLCYELVACAHEVYSTDFEQQKDIVKDFVATKIKHPAWQWAFKHIIELLEQHYYLSGLREMREFSSHCGVDRSYAFKGGTHGKPDALLYVVYEIVKVVDDLDFIEWIMDNFSYGDRVVLDIARTKIRLPYLKKMLEKKSLRNPIYVDDYRDKEYWHGIVHREILLSYPNLDAEAIDLILAHEQLHWTQERTHLICLLHPAFDFSKLTPEMLYRITRDLMDFSMACKDIARSGNKWDVDSRTVTMQQMVQESKLFSTRMPKKW